jgi:hypothetical protein
MAITRWAPYRDVVALQNRVNWASSGATVASTAPSRCPIQAIQRTSRPATMRVY